MRVHNILAFPFDPIFIRIVCKFGEIYDLLPLYVRMSYVEAPMREEHCAAVHWRNSAAAKFDCFIFSSSPTDFIKPPFVV